MERRLIPASKFLSFLLRHRPESEGLAMDEHGWISVDELLRCRGAADAGLTAGVLDRVVAENEKQRFEFSEDRTRIRARQGHSRAVDLELDLVEPPERLYHGTSRTSLSAIRVEGLRKGARQHVHLSGDAVTARAVGARHGSPVVLTIRASEMRRAGHQFFRSANGVWLTESVPPQYIEFGDDGAA